MDKGAEKDILPERTHNSQAAWRDSPQHYSSGGANQNHAEMPMRMIAISNSMWQWGHQVRTTTGLLGRSDGKYSESSWESSTMSCHSYSHIRNWGRPIHIYGDAEHGGSSSCATAPYSYCGTLSSHEQEWSADTCSNTKNLWNIKK